MASSWSRVAGALALSWMGACVPSPPPPPPKAAPIEVTPPVATAEPTVTAEPAPPPDPGPTVVELPASPACVVQGDWRARKWRTSLLVRPGGPAFANATDGKGRLHFPSGPRPATQGLELEADGIAVSGHVDSKASDLRAARAFWLNGLALPTTYALLDWTEAAPGHITVTTETPGALEVLAPPLSASVACGDVLTSTGSFNAEDAIDGYKRAKPRRLVTGKPVEIALKPGGDVVARARPKEGVQAVVSLLEVRGASSRIAWSVESLEVVGWVKSSDLQMPGPLTGYGIGSGRLGPPRYTDQYKKVVCPADVDLVVEIDEELFLPGRIRAGTVIELQSQNDRFTTVRVRSQRIVPSDEARWMAPTPDLRDCQSPKP